MLTPLLTTKLYVPPPHPDLVLRPRLVERLNAGPRSGRKLALISAQAGSGKTTLLSGWAAQIRDQVAWLSLDPEDSDPVRFWRYLVAALQTIHAVGQDVLPLLQAPQFPPVQSFLTPLLNEIAALSDQVVLVRWTCRCSSGWPPVGR